MNIVLSAAVKAASDASCSLSAILAGIDDISQRLSLDFYNCICYSKPMIPPHLVLVILIGCPLTDVVNPTNEWVEADGKALDMAVETCKGTGPKTPCLKTFKKISDGVYSAECGKEE